MKHGGGLLHGEDPRWYHLRVRAHKSAEKLHHSPRIILASLVMAAASLASWPALIQPAKPSRMIVLDHAELKLTPAALVFNQEGELYVAYRDKGSGKKSSAIWVQVFDPATGKKLRSRELQTAEISLPNGANQFLLSPDNSLLVYSQFNGGTLITILNAATLQTVSQTTSLPDGVDKEFPKVVGVGPSDAWVLVTAEIDKEFPPGVVGVNPETGALVMGGSTTFRMHGVDERLVRLDARDLSHVLSDAIITNPIPESGFAVGSDGRLRIINANMLFNYDADTKKAALELSIHNHDDIRNALFLNDHSLLLWSNQNEFGYLYRFKQGSSSLERSQRIEKSGVAKVFVSPDQLYGAALCEHQNTGEWRFGAITSRTAVIFDAKTLKILAQVPIQKDVYPELAIWHGSGKIVLATQASSNKLAIYELVEF
jgi:hypothetical protein